MLRLLNLPIVEYELEIVDLALFDDLTNQRCRFEAGRLCRTGRVETGSQRLERGGAAVRVADLDIWDNLRSVLFCLNSDFRQCYFVCLWYTINILV